MSKYRVELKHRPKGATATGWSIRTETIEASSESVAIQILKDKIESTAPSPREFSATAQKIG